MKVYCLFAYDRYYPTGEEDLKGIYLSQEKAWESEVEYLDDYDFVRTEEQQLKGTSCVWTAVVEERAAPACLRVTNRSLSKTGEGGNMRYTIECEEARKSNEDTISQS